MLFKLQLQLEDPTRNNTLNLGKLWEPLARRWAQNSKIGLESMLSFSRNFCNNVKNHF